MSKGKPQKLSFIGTLIKSTKYTCTIDFNGFKTLGLNRYKDVNSTKIVRFTAKKFPIKFHGVENSDTVEIKCIKRFSKNKLLIIPTDILFIEKY